MRGWETVLAVVGAGLAGWLAPADLFRELSAEVIAAVGFVMAALIPAMILAATALRAGGFSPLALHRLHAELDRQVALFGGLFVYCLATVAVVIGGKSIEWSASTSVMPLWWPAWMNLGRIAMMLTVFGLLFVALRSATLVAGIRSILNLSADLAISEAVSRLAKPESSSALESYKVPEGYASRIDATH